MLRLVAAVVAGYLAMALLMFALFSLLYVGLGTEGAFQAGSYDVTVAWNMLSMVLGFVAAVAGGFVAAKIAPGTKAPLALAVVVLVLSFVNVFASLSRPDSGVRSVSVPTMEAMQNARQPMWLLVLTPLLGAAGIVLGSRLAVRRTV